jgi:hypothetical protein
MRKSLHILDNSSSSWKEEETRTGQSWRRGRGWTLEAKEGRGRNTRGTIEAVWQSALDVNEMK